MYAKIYIFSVARLIDWVETAIKLKCLWWASSLILLFVIFYSIFCEYFGVKLQAKQTFYFYFESMSYAE